jgi:acetyl esterase/lipase
MSAFPNSTVLTSTYKTVDSHPILIDTVIPDGLGPGTHPLIVNYHGGFLITGSRNYAPFLAPWIPAYAASRSAILVSPDYRLLPEATGVDIVADLKDSWSWIQTRLNELLAQHGGGHQVDLSKILVLGASAGGYCALQVGLNLPGEVKACMPIYPVLDYHGEFFSKGPGKLGLRLSGNPASAYDEKKIDEHLAKMEAGVVVSAAGDEVRNQLAGAIVFHGRINEFMGNERECFPFLRVEDGAKLPEKVWIIHGYEDSAVPVEGSKKFVKLAEERCPESQVRLTVRPGEHGFDAGAKLDDEWLKEGLEWLEISWLGERQP